VSRYGKRDLVVQKKMLLGIFNLPLRCVKILEDTKFEHTEGPAVERSSMVLRII